MASQSEAVGFDALLTPEGRVLMGLRIRIDDLEAQIEALKATLDRRDQEIQVLKTRKFIPGQTNVPDHIYVMGRLSGGPVKVGISHDPERRRAQLDAGPAHEFGPLKVLLSVEVGAGARVLERRCHNALRAYRCAKRGPHFEWFNVDAEVALRVVKSNLGGA